MIYRIIFLLFFIIFLFFGNPSTKYSYFLIPDFNKYTSSISNDESVSDRIAYEYLILKDPKTNKIPNLIELKELQFIQQQFSVKRRRGWNLNNSSNFNSFEMTGPQNIGGRTRSLALDIKNENNLLAGGVSGGVWKSKDGGKSWKKTSNPLNRNSVTCIVQDTRNGKENIWYHGTGELVGNSANGGSAPFYGSGIYKSIDNGESWNIITSTLPTNHAAFNSNFQYISNIVLNPSNKNQDEIYVATFGGVLRSIDGGSNWINILGEDLRLHPKRIAIAPIYTNIQRSKSGYFLAGISNSTIKSSHNYKSSGIFFSQNGINWYNITPNSMLNNLKYRKTEIAISNSNPKTSYIYVDGKSPVFLKLEIIIPDNPAQQVITRWKNISSNIPKFGGETGDFDSQSSYNLMLKIDPKDENTVILGGTNLYISTNGFASSSQTKWIGGYNKENTNSYKVYDNHHPDQHNLVFYPSNSNKVLSANDGGLFLSKNIKTNNVTWTSLNNGYVTTQFHTISLSKETDDFMIGGLQDNGVVISSGSKKWEKIIGGDGGYVNTTKDKKLWYAGVQNGKTYRITLNQKFDLTSYSRIDPKPLVNTQKKKYLFINPFQIDPTNSGRMIIGGGNWLYLHENLSQLPGLLTKGTYYGWEKISQFETEGIFSVIEYAPNGKIAYAGTSKGEVFKIINANSPTERKIIDISNPLMKNSFVSSISVNPTNYNHILITVSNYRVLSIFENSNTSNNDIHNVSSNLEEFQDGTGNGPSIRWGEIIPKNNGNYLYVVGTSSGLFSAKIDPLNKFQKTNWIQESENIIGNSVIKMMDYRAKDGVLLISTHGNGVFKTTVKNFLEINDENSITSSTYFEKIFPNPMNSETLIEYNLSHDDIVKIDIFTLGGQLVNNLLWAYQSKGKNYVYWDGTNSVGRPLDNGVYLCRLQVNKFDQTQKIILKKN